MRLITITEELLEIVLEIVNSNPEYNIQENESPYRSAKEVSVEFLNTGTDSFLVTEDNKYIGIIDFLKKNPKDNYPWIGLFMIHRDYQGKGYGKKVYQFFEEKLKQEKFNDVRIGVLQTNVNARIFWESLGFSCYANSTWKGKSVDCFEKHLY